MRRQRNAYIAGFLAAVLLLGAVPKSMATYSRTVNAFDDRDPNATFDGFMSAAGFNLSLIHDPPNPKTTAYPKWHSKYGNKSVQWQNDNQVQFYNDNIATTTAHVWALDGAAAIGGGGSLGMPSGSGADIVAMGLSQLGVREIPANSNCVSYVRWFNEWEDTTPYTSYKDWNWCCIFVLWCASQFDYVGRGSNGVFKWTGSCTQQFNYMVNQQGCSWTRTSSVWDSPSNQVLPGDIMFFSKTGSFTGDKVHIGIVVDVGPDNSYIMTVEGNTGGKCSPDGEIPGGGVARQKYTKTTNYAAMQNGFIVRPNYP